MYNALNISENQRILIVAPHPDDETLGCGGILALYGPQCDVLLMTDGRKGGPADGSQTEEETAAIRKTEFELAMDHFCVHSYTELEIPDSTLKAKKNKILSMDLKVYDYIFAPNRNERHPDHRAAYDIIKRLCKRQKAKAQLLEYEVWSPIVAPNRFLDISQVMNRKMAGLENYVSQTTELDYGALAKGLNAYRGAPHHIAYCEAFYSEAVEKHNRKQTWFAKLPSGVRKLLLLGRRS